MDIVDIVVCHNKYNNVHGKRHVSFVGNVSFWLRVNKDYINNASCIIVDDYKKFLNQKDIDTISKGNSEDDH